MKFRLPALSPQKRQTLRSSATGWLVVLTGLLAVQGASALVLIMVARRVPPVEYGQYLATYGLLSLLLVVPNFGLDAWLLTTSHATRVSWRETLGLRAGLVGLWCVGVIAFSPLLPADSFPQDLVVLTAVGLAFDSLVWLSYTALRVQGAHRRVAAMQFVSAAALIGVTLLLPIGAGRITIFAAGRMLVSIGTAAVALFLARRCYGGRGVTMPVSEVLRAAWPFASAELATAIYMKADLTLVAWFLGPAASGVYGPALNMVNLTFMVPNALYLFVVPLLTPAYRTSRQKFVQLGVGQGVAQAVVGLVMSIGLFALAPWLITLIFGPMYRLSAIVLRILSPIPFLKSLNFGVGALLSTSGCQRQRSTVQVLCAGFNVVANLLVINTYGIGGVALVYTFSEIFLLLGYALTLRRQWQSRIRLATNAELETGA